ncbi:MAG: helix-turn-helix transcriptional regulator [Lentisphaeria bacterium]|nr:helix-turn-helix transcriptional regulator [Lentisphaeria bacterium]
METIPNESCPVSVIRTAAAQYAAGESYLIRIVLSGCGAATDEKSVVLLRPGTAVLIRPDEAPRIEMLTEAMFLDFYFNQETAALMKSGAPTFAEHHTRQISAAELKQVEFLGDAICSEQQAKKPGYALAVMEKLLALARLLFQDGKQDGKPERKIAESLLFITENYFRDITLRDLGEFTGMSISYYRRSFRQFLGISPIDCLLNYRLRQSETILRETELPIAAVAVETGFSDANYFSRIFSRRKGMNPRKWRQLSRKK